MKGCNASSFFNNKKKKNETKDLDNKNLYEKCKHKSTKEIKTFFPKRFLKGINENQKSILLNTMMLFDIRNAIVSLFKKCFIRPLEYQSAIKSKPNPKSEESIAERTKLRKRLDEIAKKEKTIDLNLFNYYFKYSSPSDMYKKLSKVGTENNKVKVNFIKDDMTNLKKKTFKMRLKMMWIKSKR